MPVNKIPCRQNSFLLVEGGIFEVKVRVIYCGLKKKYLEMFTIHHNHHDATSLLEKGHWLWSTKETSLQLTVSRICQESFADRGLATGFISFNTTLMQNIIPTNCDPQPSLPSLGLWHQEACQGRPMSRKGLVRVK